MSVELKEELAPKESQSYVTKPEDFQAIHYYVVEKIPDEAQYAWLDDFGWI